MSNRVAWVQALARQADADFTGWELYQKNPAAVATECHKLLLLQMACEKLCKAHLVNTGADPNELRRSHGYTKTQLPRIIRAEMSFVDTSKERNAKLKNVVSFTRRLAGEVEILSPAVKRGGQREDNCEYPWEVDGRVFSPLDHSFSPSQLLLEEGGRAFLKALRLAIRRLLVLHSANATDK